MKNIYSNADRIIKLLREKSEKLFSDAQRRMMAAGYTDKAVETVTKELYDDLEAQTQAALEKLAQAQYKAAEVDADERNAPGLEWLLLLLMMPNPVTEYVYWYEQDRKRDRAAESIQAAGRKVDEITETQPNYYREEELKSARGYWDRMVQQYADIVADEATIKAYKDSGIKYVRWNTAQDDKRCQECKNRDGKVYPINSIPTKPHMYCRCWISPVK